jgi:hypothetical protein
VFFYPNARPTLVFRFQTWFFSPFWYVSVFFRFFDVCLSVWSVCALHFFRVTTDTEFWWMMTVFRVLLIFLGMWDTKQGKSHYIMYRTRTFYPARDNLAVYQFTYSTYVM